jgi:localization factor PodJL
MRHTIPWSVKGVDQDAREAAKEAARRSGMSLGEWLNTVIADQAVESGRDEIDNGLSTVTRRLESISQRLDSFTRRESETAIPRASVATSENGDIVRALDAVARLAELSERRSAAAIEAVERLGAARPTAPAPQPAPRIEPSPAPVSSARAAATAQLDEIARSIRNLDAPMPAPERSPPPAPARAKGFHLDIDATVAEIAARQRALDISLPEAARPPVSPPVPATADRDLAPIAAKLDVLGRQLDEVLRQPPPRPAAPDRTAIAGEISKLSQRIDAFHKPADDGLGQELKTLSSRIEQMRREIAERESQHNDHAVAELRADIAAIAEQLVNLAPRRAVESLEAEIHTLSDRLDEVRAQGISAEPLRHLVAEFERTVAGLMPAEGIADELKAISFKLDTVKSKGLDGSLIERLTDETLAIRAMLAGTATRDTVDTLAAQIAALGERIDVLAASRPESDAEALASAIEARIDEIATRLASASQSAQPQGIAANPQLEEALRRLADKLDDSYSRPNDPKAMAEIERHILALAAKIDASDARFAQLGTIERGLSDLFVQMEEMRASAIEAAERAARGAVASTADRDGADVDALRREIEQLRQNHSAELKAAAPVEAVQQTLDRVVKRIAEIEAPSAAPDLVPAAPIAPMNEALPAAEERRVAEPAAAPLIAERPAAPLSRQAPAARPPGSVDLPLEPGSGAPRLRPPASGSAPLGGSKADFIAAARRAAQAASEPTMRSEPDEPAKPSLFAKLRGAGRKAPAEAVAAPVVKRAKDKPPVAPPAPVAQAAPPVLIEPSVDQPEAEGADAGLGAKLAANRKTIVMAIAAALLVMAAGISTLPKLRNWTAPGEPNQTVVAPQGRNEAPPMPAAGELPRAPQPSTYTPASSSSTPVELTPPAPAAGNADPAPAAPATEGAAPETTGSVTPAPRAAAPPAGTTLSPIGWQPVDTRTGRAAAIPAALKAAAEAGDPAAAYEMGTRHLEGRGTAVSATEAAKWYQRAADAGIAPAQYRLGSLYEKGTGVLRDHQRARRLYERAAEAGNGKAMHNLAVMFAQGQASERPDYKVAAQWFRRAADHGVTDSQYNLGILYGRGLGVDQSLAESYKWFSLAAAGGDQDAAKKRDEVAQRLDAQTLVAARLAVQTFVHRPEPENAVRVAAPPGGWGDEPTATQPARPAQRRAQSPSR